MKFQPTQDELAKGVTHVDSDLDDLDSIELAVPGSEWGERHLGTLHVVLFDELPLACLFPSEYLPSVDHPVYQELAPEFLKASEDDLKEFSLRRSQFRKNIFHQAFLRIAEAATTRPAHVPGTLGHARQPSTASDLSTSSNEDKDEETSRQIFSAIMDNIASSPEYHHISSEGLIYNIELSVQSQPMRVFLGTKRVVTVINDGGLYLTRQGEYTGSNRSGEVPLLSLEAKRRHAGNVRRPGGQGEPYSPGVLAQEVAELLGQATEHSFQLKGWRDQEAFVISIHGTHLKLTAVHFTESYLSHVNSTRMPATERLWVRRSQPYDLKLRSGREEALKLCIGIFEYLRSGKAEVGLLQQVLGMEVI